MINNSLANTNLQTWEQFKSWVDKFNQPDPNQIIGLIPNRDKSIHKECGSELDIYNFEYSPILSDDFGHHAYAVLSWSVCPQCKRVIWKKKIGQNSGLFSYKNTPHAQMQYIRNLI